MIAIVGAGVKKLFADGERCSNRLGVSLTGKAPSNLKR